MLIDKAKTVGLLINEEKTKVMELLENDNVPFELNGLVFEKVNQYVGGTIKGNNGETINHIHAHTKRTGPTVACLKCLKLFSKRTK